MIFQTVVDGETVTQLTDVLAFPPVDTLHIVAASAAGTLLMPMRPFIR